MMRGCFWFRTINRGGPVETLLVGWQTYQESLLCGWCQLDMAVATSLVGFIILLRIRLNLRLPTLARYMY